MSRFILPVFALCIAASVSAQSLKISRKIIATDTITDDGVTFAASSDDAEQENNEIDALFDDDIDAGWEGAAEDQNILTAGMRFQNISVPKGAKIDSAYMIIHSHEAKGKMDEAKLTITGHKTANAPTFNEKDLISARTKTKASVKWTVNEEWGLWSKERTADVSSIVQELIDQKDWKVGNAIAFIIAGENQGPSDDENAREWESFENIADPEDGGDGKNHPERIPELVVYFTVSSARAEMKIIATDTITEDGVTFAASSDDAEQENNEIDALFDDDIDAGWEGAAEDQNTLTAGMRFQNIHVPQGAVIDSAFIEVYSHEAKAKSDIAKLTITADNTDNAETFNEKDLITARPKTKASLLWTVDVEWGLWTKHRTPDISTIVQEVVDRNGWKSGNAMAFIFAGENQGPSDDENAREWESFENIADPEDGGDGKNHPERIPTLVVYYSSASGNSSVKRITANTAKVYPNPAENVINISTVSTSPAEIRLISDLGQVVMTGEKLGGKTIYAMNTSELNTGIYYIEVVQNNLKSTHKVVVVK